MQIVLATSNKGKVREIKELLHEYDVIAYTDLMEKFEIVEDGDSFKENAFIKARTVYKALQREDVLVLSDDSGISVDALDGAPGIYSARYAGEGASDVENLDKLISEVKKTAQNNSGAHYTAAIALVGKGFEQTTHGWMHGAVITQKRGENGFGYDPCFIPDGYTQTIAELDGEIKKQLSHRAKALRLAVKIIRANFDV